MQVNHTDDNGLRQGFWSRIGNTSSLEEGYYLNDEKERRWIIHHEASDPEFLVMEETYSAGKLCGIIRDWYGPITDGKMYGVAYCDNDFIEGEDIELEYVNIYIQNIINNDN